MYSQYGQFTVKLQDGGAFTPPLGAKIHMQQKIPELTFEDFGADERIFPQAGAAAPSPCSNPLHRKTKRKAPNLSSGLPFVST